MKNIDELVNNFNNILKDTYPLHYEALENAKKELPDPNILNSNYCNIYGLVNGNIIIFKFKKTINEHVITWEYIEAEENNFIKY